MQIFSFLSHLFFVNLQAKESIDYISTGKDTQWEQISLQTKAKTRFLKR